MRASFRNMPFFKSFHLFFMVLSALFFLSACNTNNTSRLGLVNSKLSSCPSSPNCVSSDTENAEQKIKPFAFTMQPEKVWGLLIDHVTQLPRTQIVRQDAHYLHVECRSQLFGFIDDLEFNLRPEQKIVAVRSASRTGYYDFGVNRSRIEKLRKALQEAGVVQ